VLRAKLERFLPKPEDAVLIHEKKLAIFFEAVTLFFTVL